MSGAGGAQLLLVFDIDDTLYLERDYVRSGFAAVDRHLQHKLGVRGVGDQAWELFLAGRRGDLFDRALGARGVDPDAALVAALVDVYRSHTPDIELAQDAARALPRLQADAALACVTDGPLASQQAKARALGLEAAMRSIVYTEDLGAGRCKPHPAAFELLERELGGPGVEAVYVADNPLKDFAAPRMLGWRTVRVRRPLGLHASIVSGADVDAEIAVLDDLEACLDR